MPISGTRPEIEDSQALAVWLEFRAAVKKAHGKAFWVPKLPDSFTNQRAPRIEPVVQTYRRTTQRNIRIVEFDALSARFGLFLFFIKRKIQNKLRERYTDTLSICCRKTRHY